MSLNMYEIGREINREKLTRLVRIVSAAARGSNLFSEEEYETLYNEILEKLDMAELLDEQLEDMLYQQAMAPTSENP